MNNKYGYKNMRNDGARLSLRHPSALSTSLRNTALQLLVVGVNTVWGQISGVPCGEFAINYV